MQSLYFNQASVAMIRGLPRGPASDMDYLERNIKFFQAFLFSPSHGLKAALYSVQRAGSGPPISIPDTRKVLSARRYRTTKQTIDDAFIVPDRTLDEPFSWIPGSSLVNLHNTSNSQLSAQEDPRLKLNWAPIFKHIFTRRSIDIVSGADSPNKIDTVASLLDQIFSHIRAGQENRTLPRTSLYVYPLMQISNVATEYPLLDSNSPAQVGFWKNLNKWRLSLTNFWKRSKHIKTLIPLKT